MGVEAQDAPRVDQSAAVNAPVQLRFDPRQNFGRFKDQAQTIELGYGVLRVGVDLAFLVLPGEPFVGLQLDFKKRSPVTHTFLLGYTNGYAGYFPTQQANREGGYGASWGETMHIEPGAGEAMLTTALEAMT